VSLGDLWNRTLVYFGIAEEDEDYWDEDGYATNEELERSYGDRPNVRRLPRGRRNEVVDDWSDSGNVDRQSRRERGAERGRARPYDAGETGVMRPTPVRPRLEAAPSPPARVHLVIPRSFNDAQQIADKFKEAIPVILNLQSTDQELSKRLIDFTSGLTYALNGGMQRVADKVFLLTPRNVEVSAEERARLLERGGFFNQA
jgi:cell division inhibitor SepF